MTTVPVNVPMQFEKYFEHLQEEAWLIHDDYIHGRAPGPVTGIPKLDELLGGALRPGLHVVTGSPGSGKTALALQVACDCKCPALYVTLEMTVSELLKRNAARFSGRYINWLKHGGEERVSSTDRLKGMLGENGIHPDDKTNIFNKSLLATPYLDFLDGVSSSKITLPEIKLKALQTKNLQPDNRHLLIVIDSAHSLTRKAYSGLEEYTALNECLQRLLEMCRDPELNCTMLIIAERSRAQKDGGMSSAAGTRVFEYATETLIDINIDKDKSYIRPTKNITLSLVKNRHGFTHDPDDKKDNLPLAFNGALMSIKDHSEKR